MNKIVLLTLFMASITVGGAFAALSTRVVSAYASEAIEGQRVVVEKSGKDVKVRYENVIRKGYDEIVKVIAPEIFEWAYLGGKTYVVFGREMKRSPAPIIDSERMFLKTLSSTTTVVTTSTGYYNGKRSYTIEAKTKNSTYIGIFLSPSLLLAKLTVQHRTKEIVLTYNQIKTISADYFNLVLSKFKILNASPTSMEVEVWKVVYHLDKVNITSVSINNVSMVIVHGSAKEIGSIVVYLFKKSDKISTSNLSSQFKAQGFYSFSMEQNGISMVFASNTKEVTKFKKWINEIMK